MNKEEKIAFLVAFIQRMKNLREIQIITGEDPIGCRLSEKEIKQLLYVSEDYLCVLKDQKGDGV